MTPQQGITLLEQINDTVLNTFDLWGIENVIRLPNENESLPTNPLYYIAAIEFKGIVEGKLTIICEQNFTEAVTNELLGDEEVCTLEMLTETTREIINVLTGNLLVSCYGDDTRFELNCPDLEITEEIPTEYLDKNLFHYEFKNTRALLVFASEID